MLNNSDKPSGLMGLNKAGSTVFVVVPYCAACFIFTQHCAGQCSPIYEVMIKKLLFLLCNSCLAKNLNYSIYESFGKNDSNKDVN